MESVYQIGATNVDTSALLALAKANSNIDYDHQDALLSLYLGAAIEDAANYIGGHILKVPVTIQFSDFGKNIEIGARPLTEVTEITYSAADGSQVLLDLSDFEMSDSRNSGITSICYLSELPITDPEAKYPLTITGYLGYDAEEIPKAIQSAILLRFSHKELYRETIPTKSGDNSFFAALRPYKKW